jgi:hypothetical protein
MSSRTLYRLERVLWAVFPPLALVAWIAAEFVADVIEKPNARV